MIVAHRLARSFACLPIEFANVQFKHEASRAEPRRSIVSVSENRDEKRGSCAVYDAPIDLTGTDLVFK